MILCQREDEVGVAARAVQGGSQIPLTNPLRLQLAETTKCGITPGICGRELKGRIGDKVFDENLGSKATTRWEEDYKEAGFDPEWPSFETLSELEAYRLNSVIKGVVARGRSADGHIAYQPDWLRRLDECAMQRGVDWTGQRGREPFQKAL